MVIAEAKKRRRRPLRSNLCTRKVWYPLPICSSRDFEDARLRRRFSMETVCARADISRPTLYKVESGAPSVAFGAYLQVLRVLGLFAKTYCWML